MSLETILKYIQTMLPFMLMIIPVFLILRFFFLKHRTSILKLNFYHEIALLFFVIFMSGLASLTILPNFDDSITVVEKSINLNLIPFKVIFDQFESKSIMAFIINILGNIIMFLPFGFFPALLWKNFKLPKAILTGFCTSLFIELVQIHISRNTDVDDLILNTVGAILGYLLYKLLFKLFPIAAEKYKLYIQPDSSLT